MKHYEATYAGQTLRVTAHHAFEAQFLACQKLGLAGRLQHMVKVTLTQGVTA